MPVRDPWWLDAWFCCAGAGLCHTLVAVAEGPLASHKVDERAFNAAGLPLTRQRWRALVMLIAGVLLGHNVLGDLSVGDLLGYLAHGQRWPHSPPLSTGLADAIRLAEFELGVLPTRIA
jgi:hypothetical protein